MNQLLNVKYFTDNTTYSSNVPAKYIIPSIIDAQAIHLEHLIGYNLVKKLSDDGFTGVLVEPYLSLLYNFILPYLVKATEFELLSNTFKKTAQGYVNMTNGGTELVEFATINARKYAVEQQMQIYGDRITRYLSGHNEFTEYWSMSTDQDNASPNSLSMVYIDPAIHRFNVHAYNMIQDDYVK